MSKDRMGEREYQDRLDSLLKNGFNMLRRGVALAPGPYEVAFPGLAHDDTVIDAVIDAARDAAHEIGEG